MTDKSLTEGRRRLPKAAPSLAVPASFSVDQLMEKVDTSLKAR